MGATGIRGTRSHEDLERTHGSSHTAIRLDGAGPSNTTQTLVQPMPAIVPTPIPTEKTLIVDLPSSSSKAVKRGKPAKKKTKAAMVDLASSPSKRDKRGKPAKNEWEAAAVMVDLASTPSKLAKRGRPAKNEGEATMVDLASSLSKGAMVDLVSSPSKGVTFVRYTRGKT
uniref:Uncharacterized protein n=1 Tax=Fagus sylvatica TaxID=28930 RepID=A0A2N9IXA0_FAGSY